MFLREKIMISIISGLLMNEFGYLQHVTVFHANGGTEKYLTGQTGDQVPNRLITHVQYWKMKTMVTQLGEHETVLMNSFRYA